MINKYFIKCVLLLMFMVGGVNLYSQTGSLPVGTTYKASLTWSAPISSSDPVYGYDIYKAPVSSGSYSLINSNPEINTTYIDNSQLEFSTSYEYFITSVDAEGNQSVSSNIATVTIPFVPYTPILGIITSI